MLLLEKEVLKNVDSKFVIETVNTMYDDMVIKYVDANDVSDILKDIKLNYIHVFFNGDKLHPIYITPLYCIVPMWSVSYMDYQPLHKIHAIMRDYRKDVGLQSRTNEFTDTHFETVDSVCVYMLISRDYSFQQLAQNVRERYALVTDKKLSVVDKKTSLWKRFVNFFF